MAIDTTKGQIRVLNSSINIGRDSLTDNEASQVAALSRAARSKQNLRTDLMMFAEGDLFVDGRPYESKDLSVVSGVYTYAQAITHRLMTARGTMPGDAEFGVPWFNYLGIPYSSQGNIVRMLIADITDEIFKDTRTGQVLYVRPVFLNPTTIEINCATTPIDLDVNVDVGLTIGE